MASAFNQVRDKMLLGAAVLILCLEVGQVRAQVSFEPSDTSLTSIFHNQELLIKLEDRTIEPGKVLKVVVNNNTGSDQQTAILGTYRIQPNGILFEPLIPFSAGMPYLAIFGDTLFYEFKLELSASREPTYLSAVYPTMDTVPANLLKIYLEFSNKMREGEVYQRVHFVDDQGNMVTNPFVPLQPELWDSAGHRITLWLDPGRVKRALGSREAHGPVIQQGRWYKLVIDSLWKDVQGQLLKQNYTRRLFVTAEDRNKPETDNWTIILPEPYSVEPLHLHFGEVIDFGTVSKAFKLYNMQQQEVQGKFEIGKEERYLTFTPHHEWKPGKYQLSCLAALEDLAGNNLNRVFDRDLTTSHQEPSTQEYYWIDIDINDPN